MRILIAEDERDLNRLITKKLTSDGYNVDSCFDGEEALDYISVSDYDAIILDIMMPKADGIEVLKKLRAKKITTPVLMLSALSSVADRVNGLDSGANDYLVKPFSFDELSARLRAMMRVNFGTTGNILQIADLSLDTVSKRVIRGEKEISLSAKEYALLEYLMLNKGIVLSKEKIEDHIWNSEYEGGTNVVAVYINYLREKIDSNHPVKLIHTVRSMGYVIREDI